MLAFMAKLAGALPDQSLGMAISRKVDAVLSGINNPRTRFAGEASGPGMWFSKDGYTQGLNTPSARIKQPGEDDGKKA
jgi:hypothetical protein